MMNSFLKAALSALLFFAVVSESYAMISVGDLTKEQAKEMGITMKWRKNGDAGVMVWLEFREKGVLESFTYAELRMEDPKGKHLLSAMLRPNPIVHGQPVEVISVSFSADPSQLKHCSIMVVAYGSSAGDVGYVLRVSEFLDLKEITE